MIFHFFWSLWHLVGQAEDVKGERWTEESQEVRDLVEVQHPLWSCVWVLGTFVIILKRNDCSCKIQNFCSHTLKHLSLSPDCFYLHVCSWEHFIAIGNWLNGIDKEAEKRCDQSSLNQLFVPWGKVLKTTSFRKCQTGLGPRVLHASNEHDCRAPGHERDWDDVVEEYEETGGAKTKYSALGPDRENCQS